MDHATTEAIRVTYGEGGIAIPPGFRRLLDQEQCREGDLWPDCISRVWENTVNPGLIVGGDVYIRCDGVEPSTVEPSTVEPSTVEPSTVEPSTVEPSTPPPLKPLTHYFDAAWVSFIKDHPQHPMVRARMSMHGTFLDPVPATADQWAEWLSKQSGRTRTPAGKASIQSARGRTHNQAGPVVINFYEESTETGRASYSCIVRRYFRVEIPDDVLEEAAEEERQDVILDWVRERGAEDGEEFACDRRDFEYGDEEDCDSSNEDIAVEGSDLTGAYSEAVRRFGPDYNEDEDEDE